MRPWTYALVVAGAALVIAASVIVASTSALRGVRLDVTQDQRFSLSASGRAVIASLEEPISLTLFASRQLDADPALRARIAQARDLLAAIARAGGARVRVEERDPDHDEDAAIAADAAGLDVFSVAPESSTVYFGLAIATALNERRVLARLDQPSPAGMEHDIIAAIGALSFTAKPRVAVISSLALDVERAGDASGGQPALFSDLVARSEIEVLDREFTAIPDDIDAVVVWHPWQLDALQMYALDQAILRTGRAFIAIDPAFLGVDDVPFDPLRPPVLSASTLGPLLAAWGLSMPDHVVLDQANALPIEVRSPQGAPMRVLQPLYFALRPSGYAKDDAAMQGLSQSMNVGAAGQLIAAPTPNISTTALMKTAQRISIMPAADAVLRPSPERTLSLPQQDGAAVVAMRVRGRPASAFGAQAPPDAQGASVAPHVAQATRDVDVVVLADVDALEDRYFIGAPPMRRREADNGAFVLNALDSLAGGDALLALRTRREISRRLTAIDAVRAETEAAAGEDAVAIEQRLRALTLERDAARLADPRDAAARATLQRLNTEIADLRATQRRSQREESGAIAQLTQGWVWLSVVGVPGAVLLVGAGVFLWRRRKVAAA